MQQYPTEVPMDALSLMIGAIKSGDTSDYDGLTLAGWNVAGFALRHMVGDGAQPRAGAAGGQNPEYRGMELVASSDPNLIAQQQTQGGEGPGAMERTQNQAVSDPAVRDQANAANPSDPNAANAGPKEPAHAETPSLREARRQAARAASQAQAPADADRPEADLAGQGSVDQGTQVQGFKAPAQSALAPMTASTAVDALDQFVNSNRDDQGEGRSAVASASGGRGFPVPWTVLFQLAMTFLQRIIEKKQQGA